MKLCFNNVFAGPAHQRCRAVKQKQKAAALLASVAFCPGGRAMPCYACMDTPCMEDANCDAGCKCRSESLEDATHRPPYGKQGGMGAPQQGQCICTINVTSAPPLGESVTTAAAGTDIIVNGTYHIAG